MPESYRLSRYVPQRHLFSVMANRITAASVCINQPHALLKAVVYNYHSPSWTNTLTAALTGVSKS